MLKTLKVKFWIRVTNDDVMEDWTVRNCENDVNAMNVPIDKANLPVDGAGVSDGNFVCNQS